MCNRHKFQCPLGIIYRERQQGASAVGVSNPRRKPKMRKTYTIHFILPLRFPLHLKSIYLDAAKLASVRVH